MRVRTKKVQPHEFEIEPDEPVYAIGVVSRLVAMPVWTLRIMEEEGLVKPKRTAGQTRLYSLEDMRLLMRIKQLYLDQGVNREGIRVIMRMEMRVTESD